ncbi:MAG: SDR family NAD(P)-dependent oxidoreductase [bacterium]
MKLVTGSGRKMDKQEPALQKRVTGKGTDIAIIGIACRFPDAQNYQEFAHNLLKGVNSIREIPPSRWDIEKYYSPDFDEPNKSISKWCGLIDGIDQFDNQFFAISPREANNMDPQQRLLLEETWHCIENSGVPLRQLQQKITSVYIGVMATDYHQEASNPNIITDSYACLGNYECILANRLSYTFGLQGTSISIDAACASSLVALHQAKSSLIVGESEYALAGGVSLDFHPWKYISFSKSRMLSPDGQCKTFDIDANGYVPGEGVGIVLLQRLEDALADGNHIYGVIKGSAVNHGGKTLSITAPRVESQKSVIVRAYQDAGLNPETVTYVEAHGTGTSLGDPIEIESLTQAFREYTQDVQFCTIGSVKTNIGHLEAAAGIAGVIKVVLMMQYRKIPKSLNIKKLNPIINFKASPFMVATDVERTPHPGTEASDWHPRKPELPLRAGVSSFGFGGVNSHVILEEYREAVSQEIDREENHLFLLSAKSSNSMHNLIEEWKQFVNSEIFSRYSLRDVCITLKVGRESLPYRYGAHIRNKEELKELLGQASSSLPSIPRQTKKYWCLRIGNLSFESMEQFRGYLERFELFRQNLEKVVHCFLSISKDFLAIPSREGQTLESESTTQGGALPAGQAEFLKSFYHDAWAEQTRSLYSFMIAYAGICTLRDLGFNPDVITGEKAGVMMGLVLSGIMKLEDALAVLSKQKGLKEVEFTRPAIPYYDSICKTTVMPFHFDSNYLLLLVDELGRQNKLLGQLLVDGIFYAQQKDAQPVQPDKDQQQQTLLGQLLIQNGALSKEQLENVLALQKKTHDLLGVLVVRERYCTPDKLTEALYQQDVLRYYVQEVFHHYVDQARLLNGGQFTFKKFLEEWNVVLKKSGHDLLQLLYDDHLLSQRGGRLRNEKLLLMIIIMNCLRKLNQKWNLTEPRLVEEKRFYELLDLVTDEVMTKEDLVELFLSDNPDYAAIAHNLNKRQINRNLSNEYRYIKGLNPNVREIEDVSSWLIQAMEIKNVLPEDTMAYLPIAHIAFFETGLFNEPVPFEGAIHLKAVRNICELFTDSLLQLWLHGVDIQWEKIYPEGSYKKPVLPVYPFDRKSFWLPRHDQDGQRDHKDQKGQKGQGYQKDQSYQKDQICQKDQKDRIRRGDTQDESHGRAEKKPVQQFRHLDHEVFSYERIISPCDPIIQDHVITGKSIIPGASLIEFGLDAVQKTLHRKMPQSAPVHTLQNIFIQNPGIVETEMALVLEVTPDEKRFAVKNGADILCSGKYEAATGKEGAGMAFPPLDFASFTHNSPLDIEDIYGALAAKGYHYRDGLRVMKSVWKTDRGFLIELKRIPKEAGQTTSLNPRILDGIFQAALAVEYLEGRMPEDNALYVPYYIKSFLIPGEMKDRCFICLDHQDSQRKGQDMSVQLRAYDAAGEGVFWIQDMIFKRVSNQFLMRSPQDVGLAETGLAATGLADTRAYQHRQEVDPGSHQAVYYYTPVWIGNRLKSTAPSFEGAMDGDPVSRPIRPVAMLLMGESDLSGLLSQAIAQKYQKAFFISPGAAFAREGDSRFSIDPLCEQDYVKLIQAVDDQTDGSTGHYDIYALGAYEPLLFPGLSLQDLREKQEKGVNNLFLLTKALTRIHPRYTVTMVISTDRVHVVEPQDRGEGYVFGGLFGLAKTITLENPRIKIKMVDFGRDSLLLPEKARILLDEGFSQERSEPVEIIAYREGGRYVRTLEPVFLDSRSGGAQASSCNHESLLKDSGVYLLIGGAGGLGIKVAEMISKQVKANLILLGRSALQPEKRRRIEQLKTYGGEILYLQGDVTSLEQMIKLLEIVKSRYGALHGVIQTGGVLEDKLLVSKDWESFQRVMAPKVQGTMIINELTRTEPLDFFMVFSSIVSLLGNVGQADYAAANSFLDAFIHYRARNEYPGKSLSINWTLWAEGGMGINEYVRKSFEARGLPPISTHDGLKALDRIICHAHGAQTVPGECSFEAHATPYELPCQLAVLAQKFMKFESS